MDDTHLAGHCPRCGRKLPPDAAEALCASCLFGAAAETLTQSAFAGEAPMVLSEQPTMQGRPAEAGGPQLAEGERFGPYRIGRLLGRGGMGEVYEAEDQETGRRVALKVLRSRLHDAEDRARFLYEGRLAASVSHPHTVYIYGSEEISGLSVITMELLPGGTLKDLVEARGPLPPHEAVTAIIDLIGGLDAAQATGILHRDIKPSNCFVDADGTVKVGDFGLSISTLARDAHLHASSGFQGTPQFAAPEQLQGRPLDVRADIYAVGATLFYLLTGQAPFEARDVRELVTRVTTEAPRSPRVLQPKIPAALAEVVLRCLAKEPSARPATYAVLAEELRPFSATIAEPARLGLRIVAGLVDSLLISLPFSITAATSAKAAAGGTRFTTDPLTSVLSMTVGFLYYLFLEGRWSASLGKRLTGLRVVGTEGVATPGQIVKRTLAFYAPTLPALTVILTVGQEPLTTYLTAHPLLGTLFTLSTLAMSAALFSSMRRANGLAAWHDLASGTRVVMRPRAADREQIAEAAPMPEGSKSVSGVRCGAYNVLGDLGASPVGRLLTGFDPVLRRRVWIHAVPVGTPAVNAARRDNGRATRLHWLAGRRSASENWDAFEAPEGVAIAAMAPGRQSWRQVRAWLADLATELVIGEKEQSLPALRLDHIWIRSDGRLVLLDFAAPSAVRMSTAHRGRGAEADVLSPVGMLAAVAAHGLGAAQGVATSMPLSAAAVVARWRANPGGPVAEAARDLAAIAGAPDRVHSWRRALPIALMSLPILLALLGSFAAVPMLRTMTTPERFEAYTLLKVLNDAAAGHGQARSRADLDAIEVYLAGRHGELLRDPSVFGSAGLSTDFAKLGPVARRVAEARAGISAGDLARARETIAGDIEGARASYAQAAGQLSDAAVVMIVLLVTIAAAFSMLCSLLSAIIVPGGVVSRMLGLATVAGGAEVTRARSLLRSAAAWSPIVVWVAWLGTSPVKTVSAASVSPAVILGAVLAVLAAGAIWTIATPSSGPHDRLAGVQVVPR